MRRFREKMKQMLAMLLAVMMVAGGNATALAGTLPELIPQEAGIVSDVQNSVLPAASPEEKSADADASGSGDAAVNSGDDAFSADTDASGSGDAAVNSGDDASSMDADASGLGDDVFDGEAEKATPSDACAVSGYRSIDYTPDGSYGSMPKMSMADEGLSRQGEGLPSSYTSENAENLSSLNDQGSNLNCWAFAYTEAAETEIRASDVDKNAKFSTLGTSYFFYHIPEDPLGLVGSDTNNEIQQPGKNYLSFGGNILLTSLTLSAWTGEIGEYGEKGLSWDEADPEGRYDFDDYELQAVQVGSYNISKTDRTGIKQAILQYGSVQMGFWASGLNGGTYANIRTATVDGGSLTDLFAYCRRTGDSFAADHAVQIVGWDDTIPRQVFMDAYGYMPAGDGGWLVRNSWGDNWPYGEVDHPGFFWLSYYDVTIDGTMVALDMEPAGTYLNNYHYDACASYQTGAVSRSAGNIFRAQHTEKISAVNVGIQNTGNYSLDIYVSDEPFTSGPVKEGCLAWSQTFRVKYSGLQFVELTSPEPITVNTGQYFSVVVSSASSKSFFVELNRDAIWENALYFAAEIHPGESYILNGFGSYTDCATQDYCVRIKAFTEKIPGRLNITVSNDNRVAYGENYEIQVLGDYSDEDMTYLFSDSEDGEYTSTRPTEKGTWWVKAIAAENRWQMGTEIKKSFQIIQSCTVTWVLGNGQPNDVVQMLFGETPAHHDPDNYQDEQYNYVFSRWDKPMVPLTGDETFTAIYVQSPRIYNVKFKSGSLQMKEYNVPYGETPVYDGDTPEKEPTAEYSYEFAGWSRISDNEDPDPSSVEVPGPVTENTTYYAKFRQVPRVYSVIWKSEGDTLATQTMLYHYRDTADFRKDDPTRADPGKASDEQYEYEFAGWAMAPGPDPEDVVDPIFVEDDYTLFAAFRKKLRKYTVTWNNADGTEMKTELVEYGTTPAYSGTAPEKAATDTRVYEFRNWAPVTAPVTGDAVYTAEYEEKIRYYTVIWKNGDADPDPVIQSEMYQYMEPADYGKDTARALPERESTAEYSYEFAGWSRISDSEDPDPSGVEDPGPVTENTTYYAKFRESPRCYEVTWKNTDGTVLKTESIAYGSKASYPETPPRTGAVPADTAEWKQVFTGWKGSDGTSYPGTAAGDVVITQNICFTAYWTKKKQTYTVEWKNEDETVLQTDEEVEYGVKPAYSGATPTKAETSQYTYTFAGWSPTVKKVTGAAAYTATYSAESKGGGGGSGGGGSGGGGSGGGGGSAPKLTTATPTYSKFWYVDALGVWRIKTPANQIVTSAWLCDDAVSSNGQNVWYLLNTDGTMLAAGLVQDNTGNFYSLEMNHNGYYGMLRYKSGTYDGIYMEFSQKHDGTFGAITNQSAIDALKAKYGVTRFGIGNDACVYTKSFE